MYQNSFHDVEWIKTCDFITSAGRLSLADQNSFHDVEWIKTITNSQSIQCKYYPAIRIVSMM